MPHAIAGRVLLLPVVIVSGVVSISVPSGASRAARMLLPRSSDQTVRNESPFVAMRALL